ncbi:type III secretion system inner membrane ring lipoprotein SctJ [Salinarimonas chemoclinalis]|uniref:type III secretion system inner membrane ring lipoprotein SctJ n=1 Tax=Salinarimonas chemoclinalis TaxID=3241599 RepID=UPI003559220B
MIAIRTLAVLLVALTLAACKTELYEGLDQREANAMVAALSRVGIQASREEMDPGSFRVMVAQDDLAAAVEALERVGLPRERYQSLGEIFPGDGLIVSPYEQRVRTMFALNQEISRTVTMIDGVVNARVHVVLPDLDLRGQPLNRPSASLVVQHAAGVSAEDLGARIRLVVANAVQGLSYRDVAVAFFPVSGAADAVVDTQPAPAAAPLRPLDAPVPADVSAPAGGPGGSLLVWLAAAGLVAAGVGLWLRDRLRERGGGGVRRAQSGGEA